MIDDIDNLYINTFKLEDCIPDYDTLYNLCSSNASTKILIDTKVNLFGNEVSPFEYFANSFFAKYFGQNIAYSTIDLFKLKFLGIFNTSYIWYLEKFKRFTSMVNIDDIGKSNTITNVAINPIDNAVNDDTPINNVDNQANTIQNQNQFFLLMETLDHKFIDFIDTYTYRFEKLFSIIHVEQESYFKNKEE